MKSGDRLLDVLKLFTMEKMVWTAEEASAKLGVTTSTTYRYFRTLTKAGLLVPVTAAGFGLGPAIIEFDRLLQQSDPMLQAAQPVMFSLIQYAPPDSAVLLARLYGDRAMCIHQVMGHAPARPISFERGRPMPILRGATSKIILAYMPGRVLKRIYERDPRAIAAARLGKSLEDFRSNLARIRRAGHCIAHGEVDKGRIAVAAPILGASGDIQGSLTFVMPEEHVDEGVKRRMVGLISAGADEIEANMAERTGKPSGRPTTGQVRPRGAPNRRKKLVTARQQ